MRTGEPAPHSFSMVKAMIIRKRLHKGTSEAPVLSESERERRSKDIFMGRRQA